MFDDLTASLHPGSKANWLGLAAGREAQQVTRTLSAAQ